MIERVVARRESQAAVKAAKAKETKAARVALSEANKIWAEEELKKFQSGRSHQEDQ